MSSMISSNKEWEETSEDLENDESYSHPVEVTLPHQYDGKIYVMCYLGMLSYGK